MRSVACFAALLFAAGLISFAGSLDLLLLGQCVGLIASGCLLRGEVSAEPRANTSASVGNELSEDSLSLIRLGVFSLCCFLIAMAFLVTLTGSLELTSITEFLRSSFRPLSSDVAAGRGRGLVTATMVLLMLSVAAQFGVFPLHYSLRHAFRVLPGWQALIVAVTQRAQAWLLIVRLMIESMPGFESTLQIPGVVLGIMTALSGAAFAQRSTSLRELAFDCWQVSGGLMLLAMCTGLQSQAFEQLAGDWPLPDGHACAWFILQWSSLALAVLMGLEWLLRLPDRRIDFLEDLTGLARQRPFVGTLLCLTLLCFSVVPPLPGFWSALLIVIGSVLPGAESLQKPATVPNPLLLVAACGAGLALLVLSLRLVAWLSAICLHEPRRDFSLELPLLSKQAVDGRAFAEGDRAAD